MKTFLLEQAKHISYYVWWRQIIL